VPDAGEESKQQCVPFCRLRDVSDIAHVEGRGFGGELAEFCVGDAFQQRVGIKQASQPIEPLDPEQDGCRGRRARRQLQAIEFSGRAVGWPDQQGVQHRRMFGRDACGDAVVDLRMNFRSQPIDQSIKCAERRQIHRCRLQRLNRSVDQVGRITHGFGGFECGLGDQLLSRVAIRCDGKVFSNRRLIPIERFGCVNLIEPYRRGQSKLRRDVRDGVSMNLVQRWEAPKILPRFQQRRQHHAARRPSGAHSNECEIPLGQRVSGTEFLAGQPRTRAWVSCAVNGRHEVSGKGSAVASRRSVCFEGVGR
jgi:hypothetical protein